MQNILAHRTILKTALNPFITKLPCTTGAAPSSSKVDAEPGPSGTRSDSYRRIADDADRAETIEEETRRGRKRTRSRETDKKRENAAFRFSPDCSCATCQDFPKKTFSSKKNGRKKWSYAWDEPYYQSWDLMSLLEINGLTDALESVLECSVMSRVSSRYIFFASLLNFSYFSRRLILKHPYNTKTK